MSTASFIQRCVDSGMPLEMAVKAAASFEAEAEAMVTREITRYAGAESERRSKNADRMRRKRERDATLRNIAQRDATERTPSPKDTPASSSTSSLDQNPIPKERPLIGVQRKAVSIAKPNDFARFWEVYPNKVGKRAAETAYERALKRADAETILAGLHRANRREWVESLGNPPHPATWLNQDRWTDEPEDRSTGPPPVVAAVDADFTARQLARLAAQ